MDGVRIAELLAGEYVATGRVAAAVLAGSLGRGRADEFSDVELDIYWRTPPEDDHRRAPTAALAGQVDRLWPYDSEDAEWAEDVRIDGTAVTVSGFACEVIDGWIRELPTAAEPHLVRQLRFAALHDGEIIYGDDLVGRWRSTSSYPRNLAIATADHFLNPGRLSRWRLWRALVSRDDPVLLHRACADAAEVILGSLSAVNRLYIEHPAFKWSRQLAARFTLAPMDFPDRFFAALEGPLAVGATQLHALLEETIDIVGQHLPEVDTSSITDLLHSTSR